MEMIDIQNWNGLYTKCDCIEVATHRTILSNKALKVFLIKGTSFSEVKLWALDNFSEKQIQFNITNEEMITNKALEWNDLRDTVIL